MQTEPNERIVPQRKVKKYANKIIDFSTYNKHQYLLDNEFIYFKRVGNSIEFIECQYSDLTSKNSSDKKRVTKKNIDYSTVSKNTVMHYIKGTPTIYPVNEWVEFFKKFKTLIEIPLFKNFKVAKIFDLWRKFQHKSRREYYSEKLREKFNRLDPDLLEGIMNIRSYLNKMNDFNIFSVSFNLYILLNSLNILIIFSA